MKDNAKTIQYKNGIYLIEYNYEEEILIMDSVFPNHNDKKFKNIIFEKITYNDDDFPGDTGVILKFKSKEYIREIYHILSNRSDDDFYKIFVDLNKLFSFQNEISIQEFRGDYGEALYLKFFGGRRTKNLNDIFDIFSNEDELIEVKSYSRRNMHITIQHQQLISDSKIFVVPLVSSNEGLNIIELSEEIEDAEFSAYLKLKYVETIWSSYRYEQTKPEILEDIPKVSKELPEGIKDAIYKVDINKHEY